MGRGLPSCEWGVFLGMSLVVMSLVVMSLEVASLEVVVEVVAFQGRRLGGRLFLVVVVKVEQVKQTISALG